MHVRRICALLGTTAVVLAALTAPAAAKPDGEHGHAAKANDHATAAIDAATSPAVASFAVPDAAPATLPTVASDTAVAHARRVCADPAPGFAACDSHVRTTADGVTPDATGTYVNGFSATQLQTAYGLTGRSSGATVAVVDAYASPNAAADLASYRAAMGLAALGTGQFREFNQTGAVSDVGWGQEEMLDLEMVSAICPTCNIVYVGAKSASFADLATAVNTAAGIAGVSVISNSYGGPESAGLLSAYGGAYKHDGIAITVSSGDNGYGVEAPASFGTVTAVGGTHLVLNGDGTRSSETVWSGAGSGCSAYTPKPTWQTATTKCSKRMVADVSAVADPNTGVAVYDSLGSTGGLNWLVFGGTSVAAPIIGATYALSGITAGVPAALAYSTSGGLNDVVSGSNGRCVRGKTGAALWCNGAVGYDGPTGMGTPNGTSAF